jgi:hypothetical protein
MAATIEGHAQGWKHWSERVFYEFENGVVQSVNEVFNGNIPVALNAPLQLLGLVRLPGFQSAMRLAAPPRQHFNYE